MIVKAEVTPEEKTRIKELATEHGMSVSSYIKKQALCWTDPNPTPLMKLVEMQAPAFQQVKKLATTQIQNKIIFEAEILRLIDTMYWIEEATENLLKEVLKNGHSG